MISFFFKDRSLKIPIFSACLMFMSCFPLQGQSVSGNAELQALGKEFFEWRTRTQPCSGDDIPRVERPDGWTPNYSASALKDIHAAYEDFNKRLRNLSQSGWTRRDSVDYLLLRSAIARVNWDFNVLKHPYRNPDFYCQQALGSVYELLVVGSPMTDRRMENIVQRMESIPAMIQSAEENLKEPVLPFALIALDGLKDIRSKLNQSSRALKKVTGKKYFSKLDSAVSHASSALENYVSWLESRKPSMSARSSVGRDAYEYFLKTIALIPYSTDELLLQGRLEWNRSVSVESYETLRNAHWPQDSVFKTIEDQIEQERYDEEAIRRFLEEKNIMTVPAWVKHYWNAPRPDFIKPLTHLGVPDDLTSASRLDEDAYHYIPEPSNHLPFFYLATAKDPRPIIVHEGIPGHYFQLVRSWNNPDPIRRHYFDSGANEGIGFYVEEMLLQFGLFDNKPHSRETIYRFMRLRALRVEADIQLALGTFSVEQAGEYLARTVPMDRETAIGEAGFFAYGPGQAITYQVGKLQINKFLTEARIMQGEKFSLRAFHDFLMINGNVPIALQRWEYLGLNDEIKKLWN
jgi:hypothetical protein